MNLSNFRASVRASLTRWMVTFSNKRTKRLTLIASLFAYVKGSTTLDGETTAKLNAAMALASNDDSIGLAVHLSRAIWCDKDGKQLIPVDVLNTETIHDPDPIGLRRTVDAIVAAMPSWLRYGEDKEMADDLERLLEFDNTLPAAVVE